MTVSILTFASGDTDYISKHNTNNTSIKTNVDANEQALIDVALAAEIYDLGCTYNGILTDSVVLLRYPMPRAVTLPSGLAGSYGVAGVAATGAASFDIKKNGSSVGSMSFAAAAGTATFAMASDTAFAAGDVLTVVAPGTADATLADIGFSLAGTKG